MPVTTLMRNSQVGDAWIKEMIAANPITALKDKAGNLTGEYTSGPVRLAFIETLFEAGPKMKSDPNSRKVHQITILFPPGVDFSPLMSACAGIVAKDFPEYVYNPQTGWWPGLINPFNRQDDKVRFDGYTPGCFYFTLASDYPPPVVDVRFNPVVDRKLIHAGVWAIVSMQSFATGKGKPKKGPQFGLSSVMYVGPDTNLAGGATDPREAFAGVNVRAPAISPTQAFQGAPGAPPAPGGVGTFVPTSPPGAPPAAPQPPGAADPFAAFNFG